MKMLKFVAVIFVLTVGAWGQQIIDPPLNTAARNGQNARMNCTVELAGDTVEWRSYVNEVGGERIFVSSRPDDILLPGYGVEYSNDEHFDLIFDNVGSDHAGSYSCKLLNDDDTAYAQMVTVSDLSCSNSAGSTEVVEGQTVLMECEVSYHGYRAPVLAWSGMYSEFIEDEENPQRIKYITNVTAEASHDGMDFHCNLHFEANDGDENEPPTYTDSCHTNFIIVYAPTNIRTYPDPDNFDDEIVRLAVDEQINCTADGHPAITYNWYSSDMGHIVVGDTLTMTEEMVNGGTILYRCEATNTINGVARYANKNVTLIVSMPETGPTTSGVEGWIIAVAIVVPLLVLGIAGGVAFYFFNVRVTILLVMGPLCVIIITVLIHMAVRWRKSKGDTGGGSSSPQKATPVDTVRETGPKPAPGNPTQQPKPAPKGAHYDNYPPAMSMLPVNQAGSVHNVSGRDSPGYGDLGIRHFGASNPGLDSSVELDPHPTYSKSMNKAGSEQQLPPMPTNGHSGQSNQNFQTTPPEDRTPYIGAGSIV
ncbi:hypothetical protein CAPTEDRAFT_226290 [Capitella teleta]|uniref:Ig-like domain-containing protein n=1 Tax=Capitella teleta TaxID=283909 RepID=R7T758_CAPTE|nr:hypothetical protein CAPTEDRAFT_226290 [Capitella teleta]|eukprot:ELT89420.1 hypothetical protein CAPTEDRAFT_226290 [Capitella teleta]